MFRHQAEKCYYEVVQSIHSRHKSKLEYGDLLMIVQDIHNKLEGKQMAKYWNGSTPKECNLCKASIKDDFIDGRVRGMSWAIMCPGCHTKYGVGLGTGKGQRYQLQEDGKWLNVLGEPSKSTHTVEEVAEASFDGIGLMDCPEGCQVEPDGRCQHGYPSLAVQYGIF